jgi:hypothetical protein
MFVTVDREDLARKVFRRAQNGINSEGTERKLKEVLKNSDNNIFKRNFPQENYKLNFLKFQIMHF